ncbi:MAG: penicillin-binding protein activator [Chloroflexota bacterium]
MSRHPLCFLLFFGLCAVLAGCSDRLPECEDALGCIVVRPNEAIQIAYYLPLTGPAADLGELIVQGIEVGLSQFDNTLLGHPLTAQAFDSRCSTATDTAVMERLASDPNFVAIIGPACSEVAEIMMPIVQASGGLLLSPSTATVSLNSPNQSSSSFYRVLPEQRVHAAVATQFLTQFLNLETAVVLHDQSTLTQQISEAFTQTFEQAGGIVMAQQTIILEEDVLLVRLNEIVDSEPDALFLALQATDANLILNKLAEINPPQSMVKMGANTLFHPQFPVLTGSAANDVYVTGFVGTGAAYSSWLVEWETQFDNEAPTLPYPIFATDAVHLIVAAIESVAVVDSQGGVQIGRQALRDAMINTVRVDGASGTLDCSSQGECGDAGSIGVYQFGDALAASTRWPPILISR